MYIIAQDIVVQHRRRSASTSFSINVVHHHRRLVSSSFILVIQHTISKGKVVWYSRISHSIVVDHQLGPASLTISKGLELTGL